MNVLAHNLSKKKSNNFLAKFVIDYDAKTHEYRNSYIMNFAFYSTLICALNVITLPILVLTCVSGKKGNTDIQSNCLMLCSVINSIIINASIFSTIAFFMLKKCASEGLITGLSTKDIAMISFITFPILAVIFSAAITAILYKARESYEEVEKNASVAIDTYFTNPVTGLIMASAALIGAARDKLEKSDTVQYSTTH